MKIPQSIGLVPDGATVNGSNQSINYNTVNNTWRQSYQTFNGGEIYSVAQFYPTKDANVDYNSANDINTFPNTENIFGTSQDYFGGSWFKVQGTDDITQPAEYDNQNYLINPTTGTTPQFRYDLSSNALAFGGVDAQNLYFGAQWLNFNLIFPQYGWAFDKGTYRGYNFADLFHEEYRYNNNAEWFITDNKQKLFAGVINSKNLLNGGSYQTAFIDVPKIELGKLLNVPYKGINVRRWNNGTMENIPYGTRTQKGLPTLSASPYKYSSIKPSGVNTTGRQYTLYGWDTWDDTYQDIPAGEPRTAYLFKGMYNNNVIELLSAFAVI